MPSAHAAEGTPEPPSRVRALDRRPSRPHSNPSLEPSLDDDVVAVGADVANADGMNRNIVMPHLLIVSSVGLASVLAPSTASAQERYATWRDEPSAYPLEVEPHFTFGAENVYGQTGFGGGVRLDIPIVYDLLRRVPDNLAIGFGGDIVHYDNCYFPGRCGANYFMFPVVAQWNVFLLRRLSVFGEAGVYVYKGFFDTCTTADGLACSPPPDFGVLPTLAVGARVHLGDNVSFTARIGYPTITFGLSFL